MEKREDMFRQTVSALEGRGVDLDKVGEIVYDLQKNYQEDLSVKEACENVKAVLKKREVQHTILTGVSLDKAVERGHIEGPISDIIERDEPLYGIDEILSTSIVNIYGTIGLTTFGYLDKKKPGIIGEFDTKKNQGVHTFMDDLICGIAAAACSRIAHGKDD